MDRSGTNTTADVIQEALDSAAEAHGVYEAEVLDGVHDAEWPQWYAAHMDAWLDDHGFDLAARTGRPG